MKCLIFRTMVSHALDGGKPIPAFVERHLDACLDCRRFLGAALSIPARLKAAAHPDDWTGAAALAGRVLTAARQPPASTPRSGPFLLTPRFAAVLASGIAALLISAWLLVNAPDDTPPQDEAPPAQAAATLLDRSGIGRDLLPAAPAAGAADALVAFVARPLTAEAERLSRDAAAIKGRFLAIFPFHLVAQEPE